MNEVIDILLVEDTDSDAELTIRALRKSKFNNIVHLNDGKIALDFLFGREEFIGRDVVHQKPKLILLDLKMPRVDGIEVLRQLKNDPLTKTIPVVILSSSNEHIDINECYKLGANSYVVKPVSFEDFMRLVGELGLYWLMTNQEPTL